MKGKAALLLAIYLATAVSAGTTTVDPPEFHESSSGPLGPPELPPKEFLPIDSDPSSTSSSIEIFHSSNEEQNVLVPSKVPVDASGYSESPKLSEAQGPNVGSAYRKTRPPPAVPSKPELTSSSFDFEHIALPYLSPKDNLLQEIRSLEEQTTNQKIQEELGKAIKAEALKYPIYENSSTMESNALKKLLEEEDVYNNDLEEDEEDEDDDDDEYDDDDDVDDDIDEEDMTNCPQYCRCDGQYAAATKARCSKLTDEQTFTGEIAHLIIENAGDIRLADHALRARGLKHVESITIVDTRISELNRTAFDGIPFLFAVNLTRNGLIRVHPDTFRNNSQLSLLTISGNPIQYPQMRGNVGRFLLDAPSVTEFDFSNNGIGRLPAYAFLKMPSLTYINLSGNKLKSVEKAHFSSLQSLVELDLSENQISGFPMDIFNNKGLYTLRVSGNSLSTLAVIRASKLTSLHASRNKIKIIAKDDLMFLPSLDELILSSNGLKRIHPHAFSGLNQLTKLDISDNKITSLTEQHFKSNSRLQILLMNDNPGLETLPVFKTENQEYETFSVYRLECAGCGLSYLEKDTFNAMPAITSLNLSRNRLARLPEGLLSQLSSLREFDLSNNMLETLEKNMFQGAMTLTKLNLAGNPLVTLQVTPFFWTPNLSRLDVSRCSLERVWSEARKPLESLRFLSVRENHLQRITIEELRAMPKLSGLDISHNPLVCDEEFNQAMQWLLDHGVTPTETLRYIRNRVNIEDYAEAQAVGQWSDLAKLICDSLDEGPPPRPVPHRPNNRPPVSDIPRDSNLLLGGDEINDNQFDYGQGQNGEIDNVWSSQDQKYEYYTEASQPLYNSWYKGTLWPIVTVIIVTLAVVLLIAHCARCLARRHGRGPVLRAPMMLRQGLVDNKNCGLVYKSLQEEIATPQMPKRGSFYSSSTFHYDKIVPESV
ncbi:insulin-like growth factor-binding protein complex acid labile subunit [Cephus cinctus]|uniref:Insulin-like growth factor-binding protein complex acid labile subunit n=1 Tax=Cephus cinctus TaxID=211228 RepID=A0AAJ7CEZ0_CEPCN|nr:insulin-like growth factor-binding protein complex acid labile subunit [Cephus cinctus]XP_015609164.1 insulin-like growth factor-binding protein complex acid labile subunit [Cephus cinctus]XP_024947516.1 insulin-like growth factor-binding protein complex acid labile subunit [Cephus cinctus]